MYPNVETHHIGHFKFAIYCMSIMPQYCEKASWVTEMTKEKSMIKGKVEKNATLI